MTAQLLRDPVKTIPPSPMPQAYAEIVAALNAEQLVRDMWIENPMAPESMSLPATMPPELRDALGIPAFYSHQAEGYAAISEGSSIVLQTPTASGKTLSFNPAIFEGVMRGEGTAAYLFPLKALCNDQLETIEEINRKLTAPLRLGLMTGDVSATARARLWNAARMPDVVLWNPDVMHHFLYKYKKPEEFQQFRAYLRQLRYVVVDEAHTYQGVFGGHFANLRRRLELAVERCGGRPSEIRYVFATATVANGAEMLEKFSGRSSEQFRVIDKSGAGSRGRINIVTKPVANMTHRATLLIKQMLDSDLTGIVFCNSRAQAKSLLSNCGKELGPVAKRQIEVYYGGMHNNERLRVVSALQSGRAKIVISTSALEAGIDIPAIDCCLCLGFAGSIMSHRQRIGRAGRKSQALVILLTSDKSPLDHYYTEDTARLRGQAESIAFNADLPTIRAGHLCCACAEGGIPVGREDELFGPGAAKLLEDLSVSGWEHDSFNGKKGRTYPGIWNDRWTAKGYPHMGVAIRGESSARYGLINTDTGEVIEEMDAATVIRECYEGAIYSAYRDQQLTSYTVESYDRESATCLLKPLNDDALYTQAQCGMKIHMEDRLGGRVIEIGDHKMRLTWGRGQVVNLTMGYKLCRFGEALSCPEHGPGSVNAKTQSCVECGRTAHKRRINTVIDEVNFDRPLVHTLDTVVLKIEISPSLLDLLRKNIGAMAEHYQDLYRHVDPADTPGVVSTLWVSRPEFIALHTLGHAINTSLPSSVLATSHDIDTYVGSVEGEDCDPEEGDLEDPDADASLVQTALWVHDTIPGGSGVTETVFNEFERIARGAGDFVKACSCEYGCPKCVTRNRCSQRNTGINKLAGLELIDLI